MTHNCKKKYAQSLSNYIKITEITEKQQVLLLNLICLMFYLNIPSSFFIVTLIQGFKGLGTVPGLRRFLAPLLVPSHRVSQKIQASLVVLAIQLLQGIPEGIHVYKIWLYNRKFKFSFNLYFCFLERYIPFLLLIRLALAVLGAREVPVNQINRTSIAQSFS